MNTNPQTRFTTNDYVFLLVAGVMFYLQNRLAPFPCNDDVVYQYIGGMGKHFEGVYEPITTFKDVIISQLYDYQHANGRFIVHVIVQCFSGLWGMASFQIVNAFVFMMLCMGMVKIVRLQFNSYPTDKYLIVFALFFLLPTPGALFAGTIAYAVNYLWTSCAVIWVIYLYQMLQRGMVFLSLPLKIAVFFGAAVVGSLQESFTIGVSGALFFYYCFNFKKLRGDVAWLVIGFWVGTCFAIFAPANFARFEKSTDVARFSILLESISRFAHVLFESKAFPLLIVALLIYAFRSWHQCREFIRTNAFWLLSIVTNVIFIGLITYTGSRQQTAIELFSILILLLLSYRLFSSAIQRYRKIISVLAVALVGIVYIPVYQSRQEEQYQYEELMKRADGFKGELFVAKDFMAYQAECINRYLPRNYNSFIFTFESDEWANGVLSCCATHGKDPHQIKAVLPRTTDFIIAHCSPKYEIQENVFQVTLSANNPMSVVKLPASVDLENIEMDAWLEPTNFWGKVRNKIFNMPLGTKTKIITLRDNVSEIVLGQSFVEDEWRYVVLPYIIHKVEITNYGTL